MDGVEVGLSKGRKRSVSRNNQSKKRVLQVSLNEQVGSITGTSSKNKNKESESLLRGDQNLALPAKGNLEVILALSADLSENKKKAHRTTKKLTIASNNNNNSLQNLPENGEDSPEWNAPLASVLARSVSEVNGKIDGDTSSRIQNQEVPLNRTFEDASKKGDGHKVVCGTHPKKKRTGLSDQGNRHKLNSGKSNLYSTLENNHLNQNLIQEKSDRFDAENITTVRSNCEVDDDGICKVQNQKVPLNKRLEAASEPAGVHKEVSVVTPKRKRTRQSDQGNKHTLESERNKSNNNLESNHSDQNLMEEKCDQFEGDTSTSSPKAAAMVKQKENSDSLCEVQNQEVPCNISLEVGLKTTDEHRGVLPKRKKTRTRHSDQGNKHILEIGSDKVYSTLENNHSDQNLMKNKSNRFDEEKSTTLETPPQQSRRRKRKEKSHADLENNNMSESSCICASDITIAKQLENERSVPGVPDMALKNNKKNKEVLSENKSDQFDGEKSTTLETPPQQKRKRKKKRKEKRHADLENNNMSESGYICASDITIPEQLDIERSVRGIPDMALKSNKNIKEVLSDDNLIVVQSRSSSDCANTSQMESHNMCPETGSTVGFKTYRRKEKKFRSLSNDLDESNLGQEVVPEGGFSEGQKLGKSPLLTSKASLGRLMEAVPVPDEGFLNCSIKNDSFTSYDHNVAFERSKKKTKTKVVGSTHQDKTVKNISRFDFCDNHLPQENGVDLSKIQKIVHDFDVPIEQTMEEYPTDCKNDNCLPSVEIRDVAGDSCSHTLNAMYQHVNPSELCKEGYNTPSQVDVSFSVDECSENHLKMKSASKKRRRKDKLEHSSPEAKASDNLSASDFSIEHPDCSFGEGTITTSLKGFQMEDIAPSVGDNRNDAVMARTDIIEDKHLKRSASPERALNSRPRRKLLILDLNGLLVDIVSVLPKGYKADKRIARKALIKRPFCDDFLKFCFETFNVGVWSSRTKKNVDSVVDFIMADMRHKLLFCWHQSHCTQTGFSTVEDNHKPMVFKEIKKLWEGHLRYLPWKKGEYNESNTLLLDDSPYKALLNPPHTAIFPYSYEFQKPNDSALGPGGDIRGYLERIAAAEHVQKFVEQNPFGQRAVSSKNQSWGYYLKVVAARKFCLPTSR